MVVLRGVDAPITISSSLSVTSVSASVIVTYTFLIIPYLKQPLKATQHVKGEEEPNQWSIEPQLWAPESSFQEQSEAQGCTDGSSDNGVPVDGFGQLGSHRACSPCGGFLP